MRSKKIGTNYIANTIYQLLLIIIPLITLPYLSRVLGAEGIGLYSYNNSIVSYFGLFAALGTGTFGSREIAYRQDDREGYSKAFWEIFFLRVVFTSVSTLVYIVFVLCFAKNKTVLLILLPTILNTILDISWFWTGLEKFPDLAFRCILVKLIYLPLIFCFVKSPDDVYVYIAIEVIISVASCIVLWGGVGRFLVKVSNINPFLHFRSVLALFLPSLAIQLYTVLDKTMIGLFSSGSYVENGYYEQAQGIIRSCMILVSSMVAIMSPVIAQCYAKDEREDMRFYLYRSYRVVWMIALILAVGVSVISSTLIPLFFGPGFEKVSLLIKLCSPLFIIIGLSNVTGLQFFVPCNRIKEHTASLLTGACVNLLLNLYFIPRFQSTGAAFASVIAETCVTVTQFVFVFRMKELKISKVLTSSIKYLISAAITFVFGIIMISSMKTSWVSIILSCVCMLAVYFLVLILLRDSLVLYFINNKLLHRKEAQ